MLLHAHAKVNLVLAVTPGPQESGYHEVRTVMCALDLCDDVEVELLEAGEGLAFSCEPDPLPPDADPASNLAARAALAMAQAFGRAPDARIRVAKRVPAQAGLGGGSSDAAAVIRGLASLWGCEADPRLVEVARSLGADVAFFLRETPSYLDGRGDVLRETFEPFRVPAVLVKPAQGVSTGACYGLLDELATPPAPLEPMLGALRACDPGQVLPLCANNMQPAARRLAPELDEVLAFLDAQEGLLAPALLCGSGSCVCAFVRDAQDAQRIAGVARERGWWSCATSTLG